MKINGNNTQCMRGGIFLLKPNCHLFYYVWALMMYISFSYLTGLQILTSIDPMHHTSHFYRINQLINKKTCSQGSPVPQRHCTVLPQGSPPYYFRSSDKTSAFEITWRKADDFSANVVLLLGVNMKKKKTSIKKQ